MHREVMLKYFLLEQFQRNLSQSRAAIHPYQRQLQLAYKFYLASPQQNTPGMFVLVDPGTVWI